VAPELSWDEYLESNGERFRQELVELLEIPSVSTDPKCSPHVRSAATWIADRLSRAGLPEVELIETAGHPVVNGRWVSDPSKPRLLIYGHYDVQPPEPLELWKSPPFEPAEQDGKIFARGSADMKSSLLSMVHAIEALGESLDAQPINYLVLFEGEEEIGSPNLPDVVRKLRDELRPDVILSGDGGMFSLDRPSLVVGLKGIAGCQINLSTGSTDLHSGSYGAAVPNAVKSLAHVAASFHRPDGSVAVAGFYDDVLPLDHREREELSAIPFDEKVFLAESGANALTGEAGFSILERRWMRPTIDFNGIWGGFQGAGSKTVTPCKAHLKVTSRLMPNQDPEKILDLIEEHVHKHAPVGADVEFVRLAGSASPFVLSRDSPGLATAATVLEQIYGQAPLFVRSGGTVPITEVFSQVFGIGPISLGFAMPGSRAHAPNEWIRVQDLPVARRTYAAFFNALANQ
jgi:acetylornithine deacetylase/succinyl-diaminopimelate desuccinylase-like protein